MTDRRDQRVRSDHHVVPHRDRSYIEDRDVVVREELITHMNIETVVAIKDR